MAAVNKWIGIGNLTRDPEVRKTNSGTSVASMSMACNEKYTDKQGNRQESVEFINIVLWDKLAELAGKYLQKGSSVYIEGKLTTRSWDDKNTNEKKYKTEIVGNVMQFLGGRTDNGQNNNSSNNQPQNNTSYPTPEQNMDDELPF